MTDEENHWVWVFGEIAGLRWVIEREVVAFPESASARIGSMAEGDRAVLYVTRGAFHNPTRDEARLAGLATVQGSPEAASVTIAGRDFVWKLPIRIEKILPERTGPSVKPLASRLEMVKKPEVWGQYFRSSPIRISVKDYSLLARAIDSFDGGEALGHE